MNRRDEFLRAGLQGMMANPQVVHDGADSARIAQSIVIVVNDLLELADEQGVMALDRVTTLDNGVAADWNPGRANILERVARARERVGWSNDRLVESAEQILRGKTWSNPDWAAAVRKAMEVVLQPNRDSDSNSEWRDARQLLERLVPEDELGGAREVSEARSYENGN